METVVNQELRILLQFLLWIIGGGIGIILILWICAQFDFFVTGNPTGQVKAIMKNETFERAIGKIPGHIVTERGLVMRLPKGMTSDPNLSLMNRLLGIYWIGIAPICSVFVYYFEWEKLRIIAGSGERETPDGKKIPVTDSEGTVVVQRGERVDSMFYRYPYPMTAVAAEIIGNYMYDISTLATIELVNLEQALFIVLPTGSWLTEAKAAVLAAIRYYASSRTVDELRQNMKKMSTGTATAVPGATATSDFEKEIIDRVNKGKRGLIALYGVKLSGIQLIKITLHDPSEDKAITKATTAKAVAEAEAEATVAKAKGAAETVRIAADADAYKIDTLAAANTARVTSVLGAAAKIPGAIGVIFEEARRDGIVGSKAQTLVIGQGQGVMVTTPPALPAAPTQTGP